MGDLIFRSSQGSGYLLLCIPTTQYAAACGYTRITSAIVTTLQLPTNLLNPKPDKWVVPAHNLKPVFGAVFSLIHNHVLPEKAAGAFMHDKTGT